MNVYEGTIITCDGAGSVVRYLVEEEGLIAYVGNELPERYDAVERTRLGSRSLCPPFADTHIHFMSYALFSGGLDVRGASTLDDAMSLIAGYRASSRESTIIGFGLSPHAVRERRLPTREELDRACPDKPLFIVTYDGHGAVLNTRLIDGLPKGLRSTRGYNAESGHMTQDAFFRVTDRVTASVSLPDTLSRMLAAQDRLASRGIATIHSVTGVGFPADLDVTMELLFARGLLNDVAYRVFFQTLEVDKAIRRKLPRIGGCFATALDGCFGSVDAALLEPYEGRSAHAGLGVLYYGDERVRAFAKEAHDAELQIELHAIGDRAFDQAVNALADAMRNNPRNDPRHTIIHACLPTDRGLDECARLGINIAVQPSFINWNQEPDEYLTSILGGRARRLNPLGSMARRGILLAGGSDAPCTESDALWGMQCARNHPVPGESLTAQEALNLFTINAAKLTFDEAERGSLEAGKRADFVILDRNILTCKDSEVSKTAVEGLFIKGKPYVPGQGRGSLLMRGITSRRRL